MNGFTKIDKGFCLSRQTESSRAEPGLFHFEETRARSFTFSSKQFASRDKQQESAAAFASGDSIRRNNMRSVDSRYCVCGIEHNKIITTKTLSRCLKLCAYLGFICLAGGLKLN